MGQRKMRGGQTGGGSVFKKELLSGILGSTLSTMMTETPLGWWRGGIVKFTVTKTTNNNCKKIDFLKVIS